MKIFDFITTLFRRSPSKRFVKAIISGRYTTAWDELSERSKMAIAASSADAVTSIPQLALENYRHIRSRYDVDEYFVRSVFFRYLHDSRPEYFQMLRKAKHRVFYLSRTTGMVTVNSEAISEVFPMFKEGSTWKLDFFQPQDSFSQVPEPVAVIDTDGIA